MVVKTIRDKKSGRFQGSIGAGQHKVPSSSKVKPALTSTKINTEIYEQKFSEFAKKFPWYEGSGLLGNQASSVYNYAAGASFKEDKAPWLIKTIFRYNLRKYKAVSVASPVQIDRWLKRVNDDGAVIPFGLLVNPNLTEEHLMVLASRATNHEWVNIFIRHPVAGEKFLGTIASSRFLDNSDQRKDVAQQANLPLKVQQILSTDDNDEVRKALLNNPYVAEEIKVTVSLTPKNGMLHTRSIKPHPYVFPVTKRYQSSIPKNKETGNG